MKIAATKGVGAMIVHTILDIDVSAQTTQITAMYAYCIVKGLPA